MMAHWIWLTQLPYIGSVTAKRLIEKIGDSELVYHTDPEILAQKIKLTAKQLQSIKENRNLTAAKEVLYQCKKNNISVLDWNNPAYPLKARKPSDAPVVLYCKGQLRKMENTVGIVGARRCSQQDKKKAVELAQEYTQKGILVISGMAKGIDSYAHTACLNSGGYTVAIVGNGLDICYPSEHIRLMESIEKYGLLLSEYPPGVRPSQYNFPRRNRLISAWSDRLIVIGAGNRSGANITAEYSRKLGREIEWW